MPFILSESKNISQYTSETKMSPSSLYSQQVLCSSIPLSKNVHSFFSAFCTEENIEQSISYLDQVMVCFFVRSIGINQVLYYWSYENTCHYKYIVVHWSRTCIRFVENLGDHLTRHKVNIFIWSRLASHPLRGSSTGVSPLFYWWRNLPASL